MTDSEKYRNSRWLARRLESKILRYSLFFRPARKIGQALQYREVVGRGRIQCFNAQFRPFFDRLVVDLHLAQQIARMAVSHRPAWLAIVFVDQVLKWRAARLDFHRRGQSQKQLAELLFRGAADVDLVGNAPQKGLVNQVAGLQVRGKNDELVERHANLPPAGQIEIVVALFQRHDPAVEQRGGGHLLPAKIVDDQRAAIAFQLQRRLGDSRCGIGRDFQIVQDKLAADDDRRPADADPATVDFFLVDQSLARGQRQLDVTARIENADDLAPCADRGGIQIVSPYARVTR